ncbi:MAG: A24 family peptidase [Acidimicrobiia bacterium]|nr:A24 family peptidase [Acidimicrobiia bacterium]
MLPAYLVLVAALVAISVIDFEHMLIPNRIVYPAGAASIVLLAAASLGEGDWPALGRAAIGAAIDFAVFYGLWSLWPQAMGFGDVRLAALLGGHLGWLGWGTLGTGMFLPFLIGSIGGIVVVVPVLLAPMTAAGVVGWLVGVDFMESWSGEPPSDPIRARVTTAFVLSVLAGSFLYLLGSFLRRIPRGRALPFGPSMALGAVAAILLAGPGT